MTTVADTRPLRHWLRGVEDPHLVVCCVEHPDAGSWTRAGERSVAPGSKDSWPRIKSSARNRKGLEGAVVQLDSCIADRSPAVLLELVAGGASGITVALDGCARDGEAEAVVAATGEFLSALGRPERISSAMAGPAPARAAASTSTLAPASGPNSRRKHGPAWPILGESAVPVSRRALFGRTDGPTLLDPSEHPTQRLVAVLRELAGADASGTELDGIPTGVPRLTASRCAGTGVCARTCPVDALTLQRTVLAEADSDQGEIAQFQLSFDPARCTDCGQCLDVCPESALERSGEHLWSSLLAAQRVDLRVGLIRACARCGVGHGGPGDLCAVCAYRAANPFGSMTPPGAAGRGRSGESGAATTS